MSEHKRAITLVVLFLLILGSFSAWVVTAPEFSELGDKANRTVVTRLVDAARARITTAYDMVTGKSGGKQGTKNRNAGKGAENGPTGPARVRVVDPRSKPIPDVTVVFRSAKGKSFSTKTNGRGQAETKLPMGDYDLALSHAKYSNELRSGLKMLGPDKGINLQITLDARVQIKGIVLSEEGKPIAGAQVSGERNWLQQFTATAGVFLDDAAYPTVVTGADGKFVLDGVSVGRNSFNAVQIGYGRALERLDVPAGGLGKELKLILKRPAQISGRVVNEDKLPVAGVRIMALRYQPYGQAAVDLPTTAIVSGTNGRGEFKLPKLFSDTYYTLRFENAQYAVMDIGNVSAGTTGMQVELQRGGDISGRVQYLDRPATGALVMVQALAVVNGTTVTRMIKTSGGGSFAFKKLPYGAYDLSVDYGGLVNEPRAKVPCLKDRPSTGVLLEVYQPANLQGTVLDSFTREAIAGAAISVRATYGFERQRIRVLQAVADEKGNYQFDKLPGGVHQITGKAEDYLPTSGKPDDYTIALEPGERRTDFESFLSKGGIIHGQVVDGDGQGIGDAEVQLFVASGSFANLNVKDMNMRSDGGGFFEFSRFPIGQSLTLYASARKEGFAKHHSNLIELTPAQPEVITKVEMGPGGVITGRITDTNGTALYGAKITFDSREFPGDPSPSEFYTFSDIDGNFLLERCSPGRAVLVVDREDYVRQTKGITVPAGRLLSKQNFKLVMARKISGVVADYKGNPIADATVLAAPRSGATGSGRDKTNKKGEYEIAGLGNGNFRLEASFNLTTPDGPQSYTFLVPEVPSGSIGVPVDCDLEPSALGKVRGELGTAIDNFTVTLRSRSDTNPAQLFRFNFVRKFSNAGGNLRIMHVPRGLYTLKVEAPGYETWENKEIVVGPGNRTNLPPIRMKSSSGIIGTIVSASKGTPVQGALIRVLDDSRNEIETVNRVQLQGYQRSDILEYLSTAFDSDAKYDPDPNTRLIARVRGNVVTTKQSNVYGKFNVNDIGAGNYTLEFEHPMFRPLRLRNIKVNRGKPTDLDNVELQPGGVIRGRVIDLEGSGISNAQIQIKGEIQGRNRANTDVAGNFVLRGIQNGDWTLEVRATLNGRQVYAWKRIAVRADETSNVDFILDTSAVVSGAIQLSSGAVRSGTVRLYYVDDTSTVLTDIVYSANINSAGFSMSNIPSGRYFAVVNGTGSRGTFAFWTWLDLNRGRNSVNLAVANGLLSGKVVSGADGKNSAGAKIEISLDVNGVLVPASVQNLLKINRTADSAGNYSFATLQPGTYRVWAGARGQQTMPLAAVSIGSGQAVTGFRVAVP